MRKGPSRESEDIVRGPEPAALNYYRQMLDSEFDIATAAKILS
jgi:hypothetical protein